MGLKTQIWDDRIAIMNQPINVTIESIDIEGKGIARIDGKTVFINSVLPGEKVSIEIYKKRANFDLGRVVAILEQSPDRVTPECPNFGICGGCSMQHLAFTAQIVNKEKVLIDNLYHIGRNKANEVLPPIKGKAWGYRHRARLSARYVLKKEAALVGFREKASSYVAEMKECKILPQHISGLIPGLRELLTKLSIRERIPQIEVAVGDKVSVLVLRVMEALSLEDENLVREFTDQHNQNTNTPIQIWLQPKGPDSCYPFYPETSAQLSYSLPKYNIEMPYYPTEFTQVNPLINQEMVNLAIKLLDPQAHETIADFFCGIGNFTLPLASLAKKVIGIEGNQQLVNRALANARHNNLAHKVNCQVGNLFKIDEEWLVKLGHFDKWLIDPPRDGAIELVKAITSAIAPQTIVYVSCNPTTLARDSYILTHEKGYILDKAGVMNMFPHTSHIESIALFKKN